MTRFWHKLYGPQHNNWDSEAATSRDAKPEHREEAMKFFFQRLGDGWLIDKTCINVMRIPYLYKLFPKSIFIYIYRDGRDNINSLIKGWKQGARFSLLQYLGPPPCEVKIDGGRYKHWCFFLPPDWRRYNNSPLEEVCAYQWIVANKMALEAKKNIPKAQWIEVRYEDMFKNPMRTFEKIFAKLNLPFESHIKERCQNLLLYPVSIINGPPKLGKWKYENPKAIERIIDIIRPLMSELKYEL